MYARKLAFISAVTSLALCLGLAGTTGGNTPGSTAASIAGLENSGGRLAGNFQNDNRGSIEVQIDSDWEVEFAEVAQRIREIATNQYVHAEIVSSLEKTGEFVFNASPENGVVDLIDSLGANVSIKVFPNSLSERDLADLNTRIHYAALDHFGKAIPIGTSPTPVDNEIRISLPLSHAAHARTQSLHAAIEDVMTETEISVAQVLIEYGNEDVSALETIVGGAQLRRGSFNLCTAGFAVTRGSGTLQYQGFLTAEHCYRDGAYVDRYYASGSTSVAYNDLKLNASMGDIMLFQITDGRKATNRVYVSSAGTTTITGFIAPVVGATYMFYGRKTGASSDKVRKLNVCSSGYCSMVQNTSWKTNNGDSGGPWRTSNGRAVGIHHGRMVDGGIMRSVFSYIGAGLAGLNVTLKTTP